MRRHLPDEDASLLHRSTARLVAKRWSHDAIPTDDRILHIAAVDAARAEFSGARIFLFLIILRLNDHEATTTWTFHRHRLSEYEKKRRRSFYRFPLHNAYHYR
jgi:hypothetical protein